jgi:hypothetical protein
MMMGLSMAGKGDVTCAGEAVGGVSAPTMPMTDQDATFLCITHTLAVFSFVCVVHIWALHIFLGRLDMIF